tara:strand:- start:403 stop:672 length:270 start_codon:yes stop_codon:yes gene_type:complete
MKSINWKIQILNPVSEQVIEENNFKNINEIAEKYPKIPISTWRNIALGRSKIYSKFIVCEKLDMKCDGNSDAKKVEEPTKPKPIVLNFE